MSDASIKISWSRRLSNPDTTCINTPNHLSKLVASAIWTAFNLLIVLIGITILILPISDWDISYNTHNWKDANLKDWFLLLLEIASVLSGILMIYLAISTDNFC